MDIQNPKLQMLYRDLLTVIMDLDKRETAIKEKEKQLDRMIKTFGKTDTRQKLLEEAEVAIEPMKEVISSYLLRYNYIPYKHSVNYFIDIQNENILTLHVIFEKDKLKIYYKEDNLIVYSSVKEMYHTSLKGALIASLNILYNFKDVSKKCIVTLE
jgi:hypothetical protein